MPKGTIKKIVLVPSSPSDSRTEGYGIILAKDGQEVFFLHSAVSDNGFALLRRGQSVAFTIEDGPLGRASHLVPEETDARIEPTTQK